MLHARMPVAPIHVKIQAFAARMRCARLEATRLRASAPQMPKEILITNASSSNVPITRTVIYRNPVSIQSALIHVRCLTHVVRTPTAMWIIISAFVHVIRVPQVSNAKQMHSETKVQTNRKSSLNHLGNPLLGCVPVQYCNSDNQCQAGTICNNGVCCSLCTSNRECINGQLCLQGVCQPTCNGNTTCPDFQYCLNNICTKEVRCRSDNDCGPTENCVLDSYGRADCKNSCDGRTLCGRNAECNARNHNADCSCKHGFAGDPKIGCRKIECESDNDCSNDKLCEQNMCKIACLVGPPCGENALCSAENHRQTCYCQPGFSGDPRTRCDVVDFCRDAPCGPGAKCRNSKGSFQCSCGRGLVGDPYNEGCRPAVECERNQDCPESAECVNIRGEPKCKDVCEDKLCGPNAVCEAVNHVSRCVCRPGYDGNPLDSGIGCRPLPVPCRLSSDCPTDSYCYNQVCKPTCNNDLECGLNEVCEHSQCTNPCDQPKACGMNAQCTCENHFKQCSCSPGFTGKIFKGTPQSAFLFL